MTDSTASTEDKQANLSMQRSVSQLLFSYLPGKTVDWEDGLAIVQLGGVSLSSAWEFKHSELVFQEVSEYLERWRSAGGRIHTSFPDPREQPDRFLVGEPESITATFVAVALRCLNCNRLVFLNKNKLAVSKEEGTQPFRCPSCHAPALRQFPQVFVHGCGQLVFLDKWMPAFKQENGNVLAIKYPLQCKKCGENGIPEIPSRSERARDLRIVCRTCKEIIEERLTARCPECVANLPTLPPQPTNEGQGREPTLIDQTMMRITSYRASEAYYGHSLTILRLDRPENQLNKDAETLLLQEVLPAGSGGPRSSTPVSVLSVLTAQLQEAHARRDAIASQSLMQQIAKIASGGVTEVATLPQPQGWLKRPDPLLVRTVTESLALKTTVRTLPYQEVLAPDQQGATAGLVPQIKQAHLNLGLRPLLLVEDLPVISATFGYTRRSFEPIYEEHGVMLPTQLRPFFALGNNAAKRLGRPAARGAIPILAREGEHEGLFLGLDQERVMNWLKRNGVELSRQADQPPLVTLLSALELDAADRYYDRIWEKPVLRLVFGLIHSLSHAAMRIISRFAGLERTSLSEFLFLPLLGTVIYANNSTFKMGCMETMLRSNLYEFLVALSEEAMTCFLDPDCIDHRGACAGCLHSPEVSCRVFNHGLSRAFLIGGHTPWRDASVQERIVGYWEQTIEE